MGRRRRREDDTEIDASVGARIRHLREARSMPAVVLAERLDLSPSAISAIENGRQSLTVGRLLRLADALGVTPDDLLPNESPAAAAVTARVTPPGTDPLLDRLKRTAHRLDAPGRFYVLQLMENVLGQSLRSDVLRRAMPAGWPISIEGIDGYLVAQQSALLRAHFGADRVEVHDYDFETPLWQFMIARFQRHSVPTSDPQQSTWERTLLFACERLYRQSRFINRRRDGKLAIAPFFARAAGVYQRVEGVPDTTVVGLIDQLLLPARPVIVLRSDPERAARRATTRRPRPDTEDFFSPYTDIDAFRAARDEYDALVDDSRYSDIHPVDAEGGADETLHAIVEILTHHYPIF